MTSGSDLPYILIDRFFFAKSSNPEEERRASPVFITS